MPLGKNAVSVDETFQPSASRAMAADRRMHNELAASLAHLADAVEAIDSELTNGLRDLAQKLCAGMMVRPIVFRYYYRLVLNISSEDFEAAHAVLAKMGKEEPRRNHRITTYFGHPNADQISLELISDDMRLAPIAEDVAKDFEVLLNAGFNLMQETLPELYGEISAVVHEILLGRAPHGDKMEFDGASHYQFWGLLLLNPKHHKTPLEIVEVLAHEASHSLLFGLTVDEPLVFNRDEDLFASPLRQDLRPMDGIYHATYVSARMCWAMERIAASGQLSQGDTKKALEAARTDRENYHKGLLVVDAHGDLSPSGTRILDSARDWMSNSEHFRPVA